MNSARRTNTFFLGMVVFYLIMACFVLPLLPDKMMNSNMSIVFGQMMVFVPGLIYIIGSKGKALKHIKFQRIGIGNTLLLIVFTYAMLPIISFVNSISMMFSTNYVSGQLNSMDHNPFLLNIFLVAVLPAFLEEFTFRGIIYNGLKQSTLIKRAICMSALMFGLFHMNINQFCYATIMGIVFCFLYEATGSLHASMIVHFIFNANSIVMLKLLSIYTKFVDKMAETDERYADISEQLKQQSIESTSYSDYTVGQQLRTAIPLFFMAIIGGIICYFILKGIARRRGRSFHIRNIANSMINQPVKEKIYDRPQYVEQVSGEFNPKTRIFDFVFLPGFIICVIMML